MLTVRYPRAMRILHWLVAPLVISLLALGLVMEDLPGTVRGQAYSLHKSFGIVVLLLMLARILVRWREALPAPVAGVRSWERGLAKAVHLAFYPLLLAMPLSGFVMSQAGGHPVALFGLSLPVLVPQDKALGRTAYELHELIGYSLIVLILLHVGGALKHLLIEKISIFKRM
jgi:cytochrome b561